MVSEGVGSSFKQPPCLHVFTVGDAEHRASVDLGLEVNGKQIFQKIWGLSGSALCCKLLAIVPTPPG